MPDGISGPRSLFDALRVLSKTGQPASLGPEPEPADVDRPNLWILDIRFFISKSQSGPPKMDLIWILSAEIGGFPPQAAIRCLRLSGRAWS